MYSLEKCTKFLRDHGFKVSKSADEEEVVVSNGFECLDECLIFSLSDFIDELNDCNENKLVLAACYEKYQKWLIEFLWNNRKKFETTEKYDVDKCEKFLEGYGYVINENKNLFLPMENHDYTAGNLRNVIGYLEGEIHLDFLVMPEVMICNLLENNKKEVLAYV